MANGIIDNRKRAKQLFDFSGLRFGSMSPMDIDGYLDIHNNCTIALEYKYADKEMPIGQKIAYEHMANNSKVPTIIILASHHVCDPEKDIVAHSCPVKKYYFNGKWKDGSGETVRELIERFVAKYDRKEK